MAYIASMPREMGEKWLKALRSGEYKQTQNILHNKEGYCCVGVFAACNDISISQDGIDMLTKEGGRDFYYPLERLTGPRAIETLVDMNDGQKLSFEEIADWIEKNIEFKDN